MFGLALALMLQGATPTPTCMTPDGTRLQLEVAVIDMRTAL